MNSSIVGRIFTYKKGKVTRFLGAAALVTLATYFVANALAAYASYLLQKNAPLPREKTVGIASPSAPASRDYGVIAERNLFGAKTGAAPEPAPAPAPATAAAGAASLRFSLVGTALSDSGMGDMAIIKRKDQSKDLLLYEGDVVDEYTVKDVMRHKVVLASPKGEEVLVMKYESGQGKKAPKRTPPRTAPPLRQEPQPQEPSAQPAQAAQPQANQTPPGQPQPPAVLQPPSGIPAQKEKAPPSRPSALRKPGKG